MPAMRYITIVVFILVTTVSSSLAVENPSCSCAEARHLFLREPVMAGEDVYYLQKELSRLGIYSGEITGIYDTETEEAVKELQERTGRDVDGIVGPETWAALTHAILVTSGSTSPNPDGIKHIIVDVNKRTLTLYVDDEPFKTYSCAVGTAKTPSPVGEWKIIQKNLSWGGGFGSRWMGLNVPWGIYGIHGTNKPYSIGRAASHGCIRMHNRDVNELYKWVPYGTRVVIVGRHEHVKIRSARNIGRTGKDVQTVQYALQREGFTPGALDGRYGPATELAVKRLQKIYGLSITGQIDETVLWLLDLK